MKIYPKSLLKLPAPLIMLAIWYLSSQTSVPLPKNIFGVDKIAHCIAYGALSFAVSLWFTREQWRAHPWRTLLLVIAIASFYGLVDEFHQSFVPGRDMSAWDWTADVAGAGVVALLVAIVLKKISPRHVTST